ncbi:MAG: hypothetical protein RLZZ628_2564 [Bacteroidota bacterium]|jgi:predicted nucleotidyltransferase component of viral defense system
MLKGREIQTIAGKIKVRDTQIEKDYIITWLLWGMAQNKLFYDNLIFKGGTVLKKAYFEDYRFSEDLDFTLLHNLMDDQIKNLFDELLKLVENKIGIQLKMSSLERHIQSGSIACYVYYVGPLGGKMENKSVKIDITRGEKLLFEPIVKNMFKTYSDLPADHFSLNCYPLEEIVVEKLVALMGRTQPRDVYDLWYLLEENLIELDFLKTAFAQKAQHKGHKPDLFLSTWNRKTKQFQLQWKQYLAHQIADLPNVEAVWRAMNRHFKIFA